MTFFLLALAIVLGGGVAALLLSPWPRAASAAAVLGVVAGAVPGEAYAARVLARGGDEAVRLSWSVPHGELHLAVDPLSAFFLVPVFGFAAIAAVFGRAYLAGASRGTTWLAFNVLVASMAVVVAARQAVLFLVAWEIMSLAAFVLVTTDHEHEEVRRAGWIYLVATHVGTACLVAMFLLVASGAKSFDFDAMRAAQATATPGLVFALLLVGFGVKAGVVPFHVWLPQAHAAAPSHVSALMSGVLVKMGLYGLLRMLLVVGRPAPWCGPLLVGVGLAGALFGVSVAIHQRDLKRVLAYSSVENMGLIVLGAGLGVWGSTSGKPHVAMLGMTGALLHVWNHTLMKGLMFLGSGSVLHGAGTKDMEHLGGLLKRMPRTGTAMVVGAIAIAGLPPLNGFVSEWLLYLGLIDGALATAGATSVAILMTAGILAFVGGLAVLCFVRLVGIVLLGEPRRDAARSAHESPAAMTTPLVVLALLCAAVALSPRLVGVAVGRPLAQLLGPEIAEAASDAPLSDIGVLNAVLSVILGAGAIAWRALGRRRPEAESATWACGYARPTPRMQYTARSFAELMSERLLPKRLRARVSVVAPTALFPQTGSLSSETSDPLTRDVYEPLVARWSDRIARLRWLQQGKLHVYLVYILVAVLGGLAWLSLRAWSGR
jgi:formate hydrogenlyase subunit 3/multisubunit Na+/H+ antiporter MnhD subunit